MTVYRGTFEYVNSDGAGNSFKFYALSTFAEQYVAQ